MGNITLAIAYPQTLKIHRFMFWQSKLKISYFTCSVIAPYLLVVRLPSYKLCRAIFMMYDVVLPFKSTFLSQFIKCGTIQLSLQYRLMLRTLYPASLPTVRDLRMIPLPGTVISGPYVSLLIILVSKPVFNERNIHRNVKSISL